MMRRQREETSQAQPSELKSNSVNDQMQEYVHFLRTQIKQLGSQIDFEFERASELIFSLYKHLYSSSQCQGEKATLLNKLSSFGVQWNLTNQFEARVEEPEVRSDEVKSSAQVYTDAKDVENNKRAYNMRVKTKPQKYRYGEEEYDYAEKPQRTDPPRRGRPSTKKDNDNQVRREQINPYQKAPYKKRKSYIGDAEQNGKEESPLREEPGRSSAKWDSEEEKQENGPESIKNIQSQGADAEKDPNDNIASDNIGRDEAGVSPINGEQYESFGKANENAPISQLIQSYRKFLSAPKLLLSLDSE